MTDVWQHQVLDTQVEISGLQDDLARLVHELDRLGDTARDLTYSYVPDELKAARAGELASSVGTGVSSVRRDMAAVSDSLFSLRRVLDFHTH